MKTPLIFLLSLTFLFLFSGSSVALADDFHDAWDALERKDYKEAHRLYLSLAKQGDARAQYNLGLMYIQGNVYPVSPKWTI